MLRFVIITPGRSGSTYLAEVLNQHPQLHCAQELFNRANYHDDSFNAFCKSRLSAFFFNRERISHSSLNFPLRRLIAAFLSECEREGFGFKVTLDQLQAYPYLVEWFKQQHYRVIYLTRDDKLRLVLSMLKAKQTHNFDRYTSQSVRVSVQEVKSELALLGKREAWFRHLLLAGLELSLERLPASLSELALFLDVAEGSLLWDDTGRQNPDSISEWIENWDELRMALS